MNTLSIGSHAFLSPLLTPSREHPVSRPAMGRLASSPRPSRPVRGASSRRFSLVEDRVSGGLSLGLIAFTLPAVGYALLQLWHLVGGETLNHAVRAFAP